MATPAPTESPGNQRKSTEGGFEPVDRLKCHPRCSGNTDYIPYTYIRTYIHTYISIRMVIIRWQGSVAWWWSHTCIHHILFPVVSVCVAGRERRTRTRATARNGHTGKTRVHQATQAVCEAESGFIGRQRPRIYRYVFLAKPRVHTGRLLLPSFFYYVLKWAIFFLPLSAPCVSTTEFQQPTVSSSFAENRKRKCLPRVRIWSRNC